MSIDELEIMAIDVLRRYEPMDGYHLAFSGGKDSICCLKLCELAGVKFTAVYSICTVESKETLPFIRKYYPQTKFDRPGTSLYKLIVKKGLPCRQSRYCCEYLKEYSGAGKLVITGVRAEESNARKKRKLLEIDSRQRMHGKSYINPIIDWKIEDVAGFIKKYRLHIPEFYTDCMTARGGCIGCPMNTADMKHELEANPRYKAAYIKAIRKARERGIMQKFTDEYDAYNWWVSGLSFKEYRTQQHIERTQTKLDL